jgi:Prion-inhibition and propagation
MLESTALSTTDFNTPDESVRLFGNPPVLTEGEAQTHDGIFELFDQTVKPRDFIESAYVRDLADHRIEIQRFRRLKTRLVEWAHNRQLQLKAKRIGELAVIEIQNARESGAAQLAAKIKNLKGEPDEIKAETERLEAESKVAIQAQMNKIRAESLKKVENNEAFTVEDAESTLFDAWIESYERADRCLIAAEKKFKETLRDLEDYRNGLGELLRQAEADIVDADFEETPKEDRPLVHASEVPVPSQIIDQADPPPFTVCGIGRLPAKLGAK